MKKGITIATFISKNEKDNEDMYEIIKFLEDNIDKTEIIIFSNFEIKKEEYKVILTPGMTKYKRIQILLSKAKYDDILCFDNDITADKDNLLQFVKKTLNENYSIAWGKIKAKNMRGFIPKLINIDKNLSHDYIRPMLWNLNLGISLPGQIFMINKKYLYNQLPEVDTVYDDLMIGAVVREKRLPIYFVKDILGYEKPKRNIRELLKQRIRWSKGLAETIIYNKNNKALPYILLHGFAFNLLWIPIYILLYIVMRINVFLGIIPIVLICAFLSERKVKDFFWAIVYMLFFPFVYVVWGISLIRNLLKISISRKERKKIIYG